MKTLAVGARVGASSAAAGRRRERAFYTGMAVAFLVVVFAGFARTYYLRPYFNATPLQPLLHLHGIIFSAWIVLMLAQTVLVAAGRTRTHRRLGVAGGVLAALMVLVGTATAIIRAKVAPTPPGVASPLAFLTVPLGDMLMFATFAGAGFYFRRRPDVHKRLMLLATISILPAAVARLPFDFIRSSSARWPSSACPTSTSSSACSTIWSRAAASIAPRSWAACCSSCRTRCVSSSATRRRGSPAEWLTQWV